MKNIYLLIVILLISFPAHAEIDAKQYVQAKNAQGGLNFNKLIGAPSSNSLIQNAGNDQYTVAIPHYNAITGTSEGYTYQTDCLTTMQQQLQQAQDNLIQAQAAVDNLTSLVTDIQAFSAQNLSVQPAQQITP